MAVQTKQPAPAVKPLVRCLREVRAYILEGVPGQGYMCYSPVAGSAEMVAKIDAALAASPEAELALAANGTPPAAMPADVEPHDDQLELFADASSEGRALR